ncbi:hypothetical protein FMEAI12_1830021 [Parafrankia sp. Ea1.12]|nr:hypothetical protein FMEAI12_1830021 [Parafrankia sp. Ea1.12]
MDYPEPRSAGWLCRRGVTILVAAARRRRSGAGVLGSPGQGVCRPYPRLDRAHAGRRLPTPA